mmetsp:Transcript_48945/g.115415  ORF Transcript_48945/g.115415 Transcript_48945/m.115415 type:complete len:106 (+) Transcript_48945:105-422(+)
MRADSVGREGGREGSETHAQTRAVRQYGVGAGRAVEKKLVVVKTAKRKRTARLLAGESRCRPVGAYSSRAAMKGTRGGRQNAVLSAVKTSAARGEGALRLGNPGV